MIRIKLALLALLLSACASPREQCLRAATEDLRVLDQLIAQSEANLDRGYSVRTETYPVTYPHWCAGRRGYGYFCQRTDYRTKHIPEAIDPASEARKLKALKSKRRDVAARAQDRINRCEQQYR